MVWKDIVLTAYSFFDCAVESFDFWHMFVSGGDVEKCSKVGDVSPHGFELVIGYDDGNSETTGRIGSYDGLKMFEDVIILHGVEFTG